MRRNTACLFLFGILLSLSGMAQTKRDSTQAGRNYMIDEVVVTGTRNETDVRHLPMTISVVGRQQIEKRYEPSLLPLLTEQVPGLFTTSRGIMGYGVSTGAAGGMSLRGIGGSPTAGLLVLIDGHPQYMGLMGHPIADAYQSMMAEKVEVLRGPASVLYGSNAMSGVINMITKKQKEAKDIDAKIKKLIAAEIAAANKRNAEKSGTTAPKAGTTAASKFVLSAEGKVASDNFKANKGKLPWPVVKGYVSLPHGDQPHPVHKNLTIHNSGVEISTEPGSSARAVFGGEVLQVQVISANNKAVYIQHGDFITVYLNLSSVSVTKGQKVSIKQNIGKIHTDSSGKAVIKFLVLQNTTTLNPEAWLNM
jgi:murein DD-endopeptidase MepM/ murein hydrolase activator NlpD